MRTSRRITRAGGLFAPRPGASQGSRRLPNFSNGREATQQYLGAFLQDTWQIGKKLTVLRYGGSPVSFMLFLRSVIR